MNVNTPFTWDAGKAPLTHSPVKGLVPPATGLMHAIDALHKAHNCCSIELWPGWGLNPGFLNIYQVLFQLSYLAWGNQWARMASLLLPIHGQIAHPTPPIWTIYTAGIHNQGP